MPESARYLSTFHGFALRQLRQVLQIQRQMSGNSRLFNCKPCCSYCASRSPSPGRGHGIHREHVQIATVSGAATVEQFAVLGLGIERIHAVKSRRKMPSAWASSFDRFLTQQSPQTSLVDAAIRQHPDIKETRYNHEFDHGCGSVLLVHRWHRYDGC